MHKTDITIIGGGLAGLAMASALSSLPVSITVVEKGEKTEKGKRAESSDSSSQHSPSFDDRALALSLASIKILKNIGVITESDVLGFAPIEHIHVSDKGNSGILRMSASEVQEENLGRVVLAPLLGNKLLNFIKAGDFNADVSILNGSQVQNIVHKKEQALVTIESTVSGKDKLIELSSQLLVLADGGRSQIAEKLGLPSRDTNYQQVGVLANLRSEKPHNNMAYERFTDTGPIALLPLDTHDYKLVWTVKPDEKDQVLALSDEDFLAAVLERFGRRAGKFIKVSNRVSYPMLAREREQIISGRVALIGNAAHSLHPIAGQGFNLGLRDIASLAEIVAQQLSEEKDLGESKALMGYQNSRQQDIQRTALFTDQLVKQFSSSSPAKVITRTIGLMAMSKLPFAKQQLMRKLMGVSGQQFKLMRGGSLI